MAQPHDVVVLDESFDKAPRSRAEVARTKDAVSATSLLDIVNKLLIETGARRASSQAGPRRTKQEVPSFLLVRCGPCSNASLEVHGYPAKKTMLDGTHSAPRRQRVKQRESSSTHNKKKQLRADLVRRKLQRKSCTWTRTAESSLTNSVRT